MMTGCSHRVHPFPPGYPDASDRLLFRRALCIFFTEQFYPRMVETPVTQHTTWTVLSLLNWATNDLEQRGIDEPRLNTELLLSRVLACSRLQLYTNYDRPLDAEERSAFKTLFKRRIAREPLQYILGDTEFMGLKFLVDSRVLIPRPETEVLVEEAIRVAPSIGVKSILDIGTGSGNIAVSLSRFLPDFTVESVDVSAAAIDLAVVNADLNGVRDRVELRVDDLFQTSFSLGRAPYGMIVSNPPYIGATEMEALAPEIREHEPLQALTDGADGLRFYKRIADLAPRLLAGEGTILLEIGMGQHSAVSELFRTAGFDTIGIIKDYSGIERVLRISSGS
jgi:release factor glutamine methyltransferase